jgi:hypothetical protein
MSIDVASSNSSLILQSNFVSLASDLNNTLWLADSRSIKALWRANDFGRYPLHQDNLHTMFGYVSGKAFGGVSDGIGLDAQFGHISAIAMHYPSSEDTHGPMIIIVDEGLHTVRAAHLGNMSVVTIAGVPGSASFQDGPRGKGMLASPTAITIPGRGRAKHAYVAMYSTIRRLDLVSGELTTILGQWNARGLVYTINPYKAAFGTINGLVEADNRLFISLNDFNTIATLQLNYTEEFSPQSAAFTPSAGAASLLCAVVASLLF